MTFDYSDFLSRLAPYVAFGLMGWATSRLSKLFRDVDQAHEKIRSIQEKMGK